MERRTVEVDCTQSYLLGRFVGMVQGMEDAVAGATPKGEYWGEQLLPLFTANMASSMDLFGKIISHLPETQCIRGREMSLEDVKQVFQRLDFDLLTEEISETDYIRGYHQWHDRDITSDSGTPTGLEGGNTSFHLGVFLANLQCMESYISYQGGFVPACKIENILLLLELNFDSSMQIVDKVLSTLPETVVFKDKALSIAQLRSTRQILEQDGISDSSLDVEQVKKGFAFQKEQFLY